MAGPDEIRAGGAVVEFRADASRLERDLKENGGVLDTIKNAFGGRSEFKDVVELLKGGGAVAGLGLAGNVLNGATQKMVELSNAFEDGSKSAGQITDELLRSLPVLGNIYSAGRNIRELLTGEEADLRRARNEYEAISKAADAIKQSWITTRNTLDAVDRLLRSSAHERSPGEAAIDTLNDQVDARIKKIQEERDATNKPLAAELAAARARLAQAKEGTGVDDAGQTVVTAADKKVAAAAEATIIDFQGQIARNLSSALKQTTELNDKRALATTEIQMHQRRMDEQEQIKKFFVDEKQLISETAQMMKERRRDEQTEIRQSQQKDDSITRALDSFFEPIEESVFRNSQRLKEMARSLLAQADPYTAFAQSMEKAALAADQGFLNPEEFDKILRHAQGVAADSTKYFSGGTFESSAVDSLGKGFSVPKTEAGDTARMRQIMEQIYIKIQNKELSLVFN